MDNDIKDKLINDAKNNMPDLWNRIEDKLKDKKKCNKRRIVSMVASLAFVVAIGGVGNIVISKYNNAEKDYVEKPKEIEMLPDLNLENYMEDKITLGENVETSLAYDKRFIDYEIEADNVIYGKVTEVNSYVDFGMMIVSDIKIEVIEDYKGNKNTGDSIVLGNSGGEITYKQFINEAYDNLVEKRGYNEIKDNSKLFVELTNEGIPQYRVGEYVLVYAEELKGTDKTESYSQDKNGTRRPISYDYFSLKKLYVNPNTEEVYEYVNEGGTIEKRNIKKLEEIKIYYK